MPERPFIRLVCGLAALLIGALPASLPLAAQDLSGYFKNFSVGFHMPPALSTEDALWQVANRLRLKYRRGFRKQATLEAAWEISPRFQSPALLGISPLGFSRNASAYRVVDPRPGLVPCRACAPGRFSLYQNLDRLSFTWAASKADIIVGRQAISWGSARVINPTDVIAPFAFNDLDKEDVYGVDALRVRIPTASLNEVDLGYVAGHDFNLNQSAFFVRSRSEIRHTDVAITLGVFRKNVLAGVDISRSLGQMGFTLEAAHVAPDAGGGPAARRHYTRVSVGLDRSLSSRLYGYVEYHFNSAGASDAGEYFERLWTPAYTTGNVYLLGRHYLSAGASYQATGLHGFRGLVIANLTDGSFSLSPSWEFNLTTNSYLSAGAYIGIGGGVPPALGPIPRFRSEFGAYPDIFYASYRHYF